MSEYDEDKSDCMELESRKGKIRVCVVVAEDMGPKHLVVVEPDGNEKWFEKVEDLTNHLKKMGISGRKRIEVFAFANARLRTLVKQGKSIKASAEAFGFGGGVEKSEDKEVGPS